MAPRSVVTFDADTAGMNAELDRSRRKGDELNREFVKGSGALGRMATAAGAIATAGTAALAVWRDVVQTMDEAAGRVQGAASARAALLSLSDDPAQQQASIQSAQGLRQDFGLDAQQAFQLQFELESSGLGGQAQDFAAFAPLGFDPAAIARASANAATTFGADPLTVARAGFRGSLTSQVGPDEFIGALSRAAPLAQAAGSDVFETTAIFSQLRGDQINQLGTNLRGFSKFVAEDLGEIGLLDAVDQLGGQGLSDQQLIQRFGSIEAFQGFSQIRSVAGAARGAIPGIRDAAGRDIIGQQLATNLGDEQFAAELNQRRAAAGADLTEEDRFGAERLRAQGSFARQREIAASEFLPSGRRLASRAALAAGGGEGLVEAAGNVGSVGLNEDKVLAATLASPAAPIAILRILERIATNTEPRQTFQPDAQEE